MRLIQDHLTDSHSGRVIRRFRADDELNRKLVSTDANGDFAHNPLRLVGMLRRQPAGPIVSDLPTTLARPVL
jgi:hypothetical protein